MLDSCAEIPQNHSHWFSLEPARRIAIRLCWAYRVQDMGELSYPPAGVVSGARARQVQRADLAGFEIGAAGILGISITASGAKP